MLNPNDREWKAFFICDIFSLESTSSGIDGNKLSKEQGNIPYLTRTDLNNGYKSFVGQQAEKYKIDSGNCITIGLDTQTAFYQPHSFYTGQNIQVLKNEKLNKYNAKFFITLLHNAMVSLNWGGNGATLGRLKKKKIVVPITDDGQPDYAFMEQYIREREDKFIQKYRDFADAELTTLPIPLADKIYKSFKVLDLFDYKRGNQNNMNSLADGSDMLISAKNINNGLKGFYASTNNKKGTYKGNCITLNNDGDGGVGLAYYQPYKFLLDTHVYALYPKENISSFAMLYLSQALSKQRACFSHGYSISQDRLKAMKIMLPTTDEGNPDYEYMEQYIKAVMFGKYKKYLEYQNCRTS